MTGYAALEQSLLDRGWVVLDLPDPAPVHHVRRLLLERLRAGALPGLARLEDYHRHVASDEEHIIVLHDLATCYWDLDLGRSLITANLPPIRALAGADLLIQRYPYLRAVRPGHVADAAPLHRDTYYGASPHELSVLLPLTDMSDAGAFRVISGSHLAPDGDYPFVQHRSAEVTLRSPRHRLGFPYAPRLLDPALMERAEMVPLRVGQALLFGLSLVHGGGVNDGAGTRFSTDIRVVNAMAPVSRSRGVRDDYFVPLCETPIARIADAYRRANHTS